jgi:NADPH:quinone reductase-like Zn-dependent oxidoreductase
LLVAVRAAGINISEAKFRSGIVGAFFPASFPSGQGSDLTGVVDEVGRGVKGVAVGDEVIGFRIRTLSGRDRRGTSAAGIGEAPLRLVERVRT